MGQLFGTISASVDEKGRIPIPSALRKNISRDAQKKFVIVRGTEGSLFAYPKDEWLNFWSGLKRLTPTVENTLFLRRIMDSLKESVLDGQGRIMLSPSLKNLGGIKKEVMIVGMGERLEIWDVESYQRRMKDAAARGEQVITYLERHQTLLLERKEMEKARLIQPAIAGQKP